MRTFGRRILDFLASPTLAFSLLAAISAIALAATLVPQLSGAKAAEIAAWGASHPGLEQLVRALRFHQAYSSPVFVIPVVVLAASTVVCSWRRTKTALVRLRLIRGMTADAARARTGRPTFVVPVDPGSAQTALDAVGKALERRRMRVVKGDGYLSAGGGIPGVLGSPVFHWSLVAILAALFFGSFVRTGGLVGVVEGQTVPDLASSYGVLTKGSLYRWGETISSIGVDKVVVSNVIDGIDRGATPSVVLYGPNRTVLARGDVYPNHPLRYRSVIVHPNDYGLATQVSLLSASGQRVGGDTALLDFSDTTSGGTVPTSVDLGDASGNTVYRVSISVPLDKAGSAFTKRMPSDSRVEAVAVSTADGKAVADSVLRAGQVLRLPDGSGLRLDAVRYYARLSVYDDRSLPWLFAALLVGIVGLSAAILGQKRVAAVSVRSDADGTRLAVWYRDWRAESSSRTEMESIVSSAAGARLGEGDDE